MTKLVSVPLPYPVGTGGIPAVAAADGAGLGCCRTGDAHFLLDAAVNFPDQIPVGIGAHHVGVSFQKGIHLAGSRDAFRILYQFCRIEPCRLVLSLGVVVKNARFSDKKRFQLFQRLQRKTLAVPVDLIVAQPYIKEKHLFLGQRASGKLVQLRQPNLHLLCTGIFRLVFCHSVLLLPPVSQSPARTALSTFPRGKISHLFRVSFITGSARVPPHSA